MRGFLLLAALRLLSRLVTGPRDAAGAALESLRPDDPAEAPAMATQLQRSQSIGRLRESVILRTQCEEEQLHDKEEADRAIYKACINCFNLGIARSQVNMVIKVTAEEFRPKTAKNP